MEMKNQTQARYLKEPKKIFYNKERLKKQKVNESIN
jgi:hypothetical protein